MTDDELRQQFESLRQENAAAHAETRQVVREETAAAIAEAVQALRQESAAAHTETRRILREETADGRRHTEVLIEATRHDLQLVAEAVSILDEKLDRTAADIRTEMRNGFGETHTMIKGLDRRITAVERALHN
jgi:thioesterase domain-containing protein